MAGGYTTTRSKKPLPRALHRRWHHSTMKGYKNWCNAMTSASTMVGTMSKSSVRCVYLMAIYMVCNIFLFFINSSSELTFWIAYVYTYVCMYVCFYILVCMHACTHICMHICMYVCMYVCMHARKHVCMYFLKYIYWHALLH